MKSLLVTTLFVIILIFGSLLNGCQMGPATIFDPKPGKPEEIPAKVIKESENLNQTRQLLEKSLEDKIDQEIQVEPVMPQYNPLDDRLVSFSMIDEDLKVVLYSLAQAVGMNLILDPEVQKEERKLTLNFNKVPASTVLKETLNAFDLYYEFKDNVIRVKPYMERNFNLNFLDINYESDFDVGGDVLGASSEADTGLSGKFHIAGKGAQISNAYESLDQMVQKVISKEGKYTINNLSGTMYVKDKPANIKAITRLVNEFRDTLSKQILIEARIIEVTLSDEYQYGIDWEFLRNPGVRVPMALNSGSLSLGTTGLVLSGEFRDVTFDTTVNALNQFGDTKVISNPSIRTKHGKPAMISVGTSFTYKKSVQTTKNQTSGINEQTTDVETSTVFDGLILGVVPFIQKDGKITLLINPIKSDVDRASLELEKTGDTEISLPNVHVKEISTTISVKSGDVVVLGGLIDKENSTDNKGFPIISAIPVIGYLFKSEFKSNETRELVIVLSVKIV